MVLIQMLLPTSGAVNADGLAPLAETRRELPTDSTASRRTSDHQPKDGGPPRMATRKRTTSSWWKS